MSVASMANDKFRLCTVQYDCGDWSGLVMASAVAWSLSVHYSQYDLNAIKFYVFFSLSFIVHFGRFCYCWQPIYLFICFLCSISSPSIGYSRAAIESYGWGVRREYLYRIPERIFLKRSRFCWLRIEAICHDGCGQFLTLFSLIFSYERKILNADEKSVCEKQFDCCNCCCLLKWIWQREVNFLWKNY